LQRVLEAIRKYSAMPIAIQLAHAGRKASCDLAWKIGKQLGPSEGGWQTVAPPLTPSPFGSPGAGAGRSGHMQRINRHGWLPRNVRSAIGWGRDCLTA